MKLAVFGAGMIVQDFLTIVDELPEVEVASILGVEADRPTMTKLASQYHIPHIFTDVDEALADPAVDTAYVGLPNFLHYQFAKKALEAGKNVICEKPFVLKKSQAVELADLAKKQGKILVEAITNQYMANYAQIKQDLPKLGDIKVIECNYSQYSHRYDAFKAGKILPVFDPKKGGGALMDLNIYNIHFIVGLLGAPTGVHYFANIERGVDTSGVLVLDYPGTKVVSTAAKDCSAPVRSTIQGNAGNIAIEGPTNVLGGFTETLNDQSPVKVDERRYTHRMVDEFNTFAKMIADNDQEAAAKRMAHSLAVMDVVDAALADAGIQLG